MDTIIGYKHFFGETEDGLQLLGPSDSDIIISKCTFTECSDELASVVNDATGNTYGGDGADGIVIVYYQ